MSESGYGVMVFPSTNWALRAECLATRAGLEVKLIPTPRQLSSDCGMVLRFSWGEREVLKAVLQEANVAFVEMARLNPAL